MNEFIELPVEKSEPTIVNVAHIQWIEKRGDNHFLVGFSPESYYRCVGSYAKFIQKLKVITCER